MILRPPGHVRYANSTARSVAPAVRPGHDLEAGLAPWARERWREEVLPAMHRLGQWQGALEPNEAATPVRLHLFGNNAFPAAEGAWIGMLQPEPAEPDVLVLRMQEGTRLIRPESVLLLEADRRYTAVQTGSERLLVSHPLAHLHRRLEEPPFVRIHRSYVVNLRAVRAHDRAEGQPCLRLDGFPERCVPVSRRRSGEVRGLLGMGDPDPSQP